MEQRLTIRIHPQDNAAVAVSDLPAGTAIESGIVTREPIPQAHKIALEDIPAGGGIIRTALCWAMPGRTSRQAVGSTSIC